MAVAIDQTERPILDRMAAAPPLVGGYEITWLP